VEFAKEANLDMFSYDCYAQMKEEDAGVEQYFANLYTFSKASLAAGIPLWNTVLSVGHFKYRCPSEDDLRWQLFTSLACGCRAIMWFFFYMREPHVNYRISPIDEHGERTSTYTSLSRIHRTFLKRQGEAMNGLTLDRVRFVNRAYGGFPLFVDFTDPLVSYIRTSDNTPAIYSVFHDEEGRTYIAITNNSCKESLRMEVEVKGKRDIYRVDFGPRETCLTNVSRGDAQFNAGDTSSVITTWLAPGQMELYRIAD